MDTYEKGKIVNAPPQTTKRLGFILCLMSSNVENSRQVLWLMTKQPNETVYSGVVSLRNPILVMLLAELNDLQLWGADVGNTYLQALTKEKLYIVARTEFEEMHGHVLVMYKALYSKDLGEHADMTSFLTFLNNWTSNLPSRS